MTERTKVRATYQSKPIDDETLVQRVYRALDKVEPLRGSASPVQVHVSSGVVTLSGVVTSYPIKAKAMDAAHSVPGVFQVRDNLLTDTEIEVQIVFSLSADPHTRDAAHAIVVTAVNGMVSLDGHVPSSKIVQAAEGIAADVSGVCAVSNRLQVSAKGDE
jgi:osmotically-inducible protein OsmY